MTYLDEAQVELVAVGYLRDLGYDYVHGPQIAPDGETLTSANIGPRLAARDLMADLRAADPFRRGGGRPFSKADRARFLQTLDQALR